MDGISAFEGSSQSHGIHSENEHSVSEQPDTRLTLFEILSPSSVAAAACSIAASSSACAFSSSFASIKATMRCASMMSADGVGTAPPAARAGTAMAPAAADAADGAKKPPSVDPRGPSVFGHWTPPYTKRASGLCISLPRDLQSAIKVIILSTNLIRHAHRNAGITILRATHQEARVRRPSRGTFVMPAKKRRDVVPILARVSPDTKNELQALADAEHRSLTNFVERVLEDYVAAKKAENGKPAGKRK